MRVRRLAPLAMTAWLVFANPTIAAGATTVQPSPDASMRPPSYLIVESLNLTAPAGQQTFGSVNCPPNAAGKPRYPYGGGVTINSTSLSVNINSSFPDGTSWGAYVNNASGGDTTFDVWAACALQKLEYTVVTVTGVVNHAGSQDIGIANCPVGTKILGGGVVSWSQDLGVNMFSSFPVRITSWGWYVVMNNASNFDTKFDVEAVCSRYPKIAYTTSYGASSSPAGTQTFGSATCLSPTVPIGGGIEAYAGFPGYLSVNASSTWPMPRSGWGVRQNNGSGTDTHFGIYAICAGA